jgi:PhnB protein
MARTSTYLNFMGTTEAAFDFYRSVFGTEFYGPVMRMRDMACADRPPLSAAEENMVMHVGLPILGGHILMGTDALESMGKPLVFGNNVSINLQPDTRAETDRLFAALSQGGKVTTPLQEMFWGDYFGTLVDKFGVQWMFNCGERKA